MIFFRMRQVGFCGVDEITNTIDVLADLERFAEEDRATKQSLETEIFS